MTAEEVWEPPVTHYAVIIGPVPGRIRLIAQGDYDWCERRLSEHLDIHPLRDAQHAEVVARSGFWEQGHWRRTEAAQDEITRAEYGTLLDRLSDLLTRTANALKGEPNSLMMHDWSDLPEVAADLVATHRLPMPNQDSLMIVWHDLTCPEGEECRSRRLHAMSSPMWTTGILQRYVQALWDASGSS